MSLYLKHNELVSVEMLRKYFGQDFWYYPNTGATNTDWNSRPKQLFRRTELSRTHNELVNL